jgi:TonB family protein
MWILDIAIRSSVVVVAALAAAALLRHRSAAVRHWVLAVGIVGGAAVLPLSRALPGWDLPATALAPAVDAPGSALEPTTDITVVAQAPARRGSTMDLTRAAAVIWGGGAVASLAMMVIGGFRLRRLRHRAFPIAAGHWQAICEQIAAQYGLARPVALLQAEATHALVTWGLYHPRVLLPSQAAAWTADRARIVLGHELAHVRRGDWAVQVLAEVVRSLFWFNPLFWMACAELRRESEHACDDVVLDTGVAAADYAAHLVDIARTCRPPLARYAPAMSMARPSTLERRITVMLSHHLDRTSVTSRTRILTVVLLLLCAAIPSATFRTAAQSASTLSGTVYDPTGAVLPQVDVTLDDQQNVRRRVSTDSAGRFEIDQVAPGHYVLETTLLGFRSVKQEFDLEQPRDWSRTITLQVGTLEERITVTASRPAGTTPAAEPGRPIGGNIRVPVKLVDVKPIYPASMRDSGLEGAVILEAQIGGDGSVLSARAVSAQVHPDFATAAIDAVRQWRFSPTLLNGSPIEVSMRVSVRFSLSDQ